jgi:hypothetical protein
MSVQKSAVFIIVATLVFAAGIGASIAGPDFVPNGGFDAALGVHPEDICWVINEANPTISNGVLVVNTTTPTPNMYVQQNLIEELGSNCDPMDQWIFETSMKYISGYYPGGSGSRYSPFNATFQTNSTSFNSLRIRDGEIFLLQAGNQKGASALVNTTDDFHTYGVIINACADGNGENVYVYYDDPGFTNSIIQGETFYIYDPSGADIYVGEAGPGYGVSHWEYAYHNAFYNGTCGTFLYY